MTPRLRLPCRRHAETFDLEVEGLRYNVTVGFFPNGAPAETFISNRKAGNAINLVARDAGILISLLLQHGCTAELIANSIRRTGNGSPSSVISAVLDLIIGLTAPVTADCAPRPIT